MKLKQKAVFVIFFIFSLCLLFADNANLSYSFQFRFAHSVNVNADYHFEFWDTSNRKITTATISAPGNSQLGSLVLTFNTAIVFSSIKVKFEALTKSSNIQGVYDSYPYSMYVYETGTTTLLGSGPIVSTAETVDAERYDVGEVELLADGARTFYKQSSGIDWDSRKLADFSISLDDSNVPAGTYSGYVTISFTGGS